MMKDISHLLSKAWVFIACIDAFIYLTLFYSSNLWYVHLRCTLGGTYDQNGDPSQHLNGDTYKLDFLLDESADSNLYDFILIKGQNV